MENFIFCAVIFARFVQNNVEQNCLKTNPVLGIAGIYLRIDKTCVIFLKLFTNFLYA